MISWPPGTPCRYCSSRSESQSEMLSADPESVACACVVSCCALAEALPASPTPGLSRNGDGLLTGTAATAAPETA